MDAREHFPLTRRHLGALPGAASPADLVEAVCAQHARGDIPSRAARDLVRFEALCLELPRGATRAQPLPRDDERAVLSPEARVLVYGAALPEMLAALREGKAATPRPARGSLAILRDANGELHEHVLVREEVWLVEGFRKPTPVAEAIEDDEDRALFERLWNAGILVRAR